MEMLLRICSSVSRWGAWFGGSLLLLCCVAIGVEVFLRKSFDVSLQHVDEMTGYALAFSSVWGFAFTLIGRAHVRIDTVYVLLPKKFRAMLDILGLALLIIFFGMVTWFGWKLFAKTVVLGARSMSPLATPLVIPQGVWIAGLTVFLLVAMVLLVQAVRSFIRGEILTVQRLIGSRSFQDDVAEEVSDAAARLKAAQGQKQ